MARVKLRTDNRHKLIRRQPTPRARWVTLSCRLATLAAGPATAGDVGGVWPEGHTAGAAGDAVILGGSSCRGVASWPGLTWHRIHASCRPEAIADFHTRTRTHTVCAQGFFVFRCGTAAALARGLCSTVAAVCRRRLLSLCPLTSAVIADQLCYGRVEPSRRVVCVGAASPLQVPSPCGGG